MREQIFINGEEADLGEGTRTTLNFKSNFLGDVSKIEASNSLSINLPRTMRNDAIFQNAGIPARGSALPYRKWPAKYFRDGVEVIPVGMCVLLDVSDSYNIALYWGTMSNFESWADGDSTLQQLDYSVVPGSSYTWGEEELSDANSPDGVIIADYDTGVGSFSDHPETIGFNPTLRVSSLLSRIEKQNGIKFRFSFKPEDVGSDGQTILDRLGIPLLTSRAMIAGTFSFTNLSVLDRKESYNGRWKGVYGFSFSSPTSDYFRFEFGTANIYGNAIMCKRIFPTNGGEVSLRPIFTIQTSDTSETSGDAPSLEVYAVSMMADGSYYRHRRLPSEMILDGAAITWRFETIERFTFDVPEGGCFGVVALTENARVTSISGSIEAKIPEAQEELLEVGDTYRVQDNLPDIKQVEFVKAISQMLGLYVVQTFGATNEITFASVDELLANKAEAYDWSSMLIQGKSDWLPEKTSYSLDGWAQENIFRYKEDESVLNKGEGVLNVPNGTIEQSSDALTLPFAASDWSVVPIYRTNENGEVERVDIEPRIMEIVSNKEGKAALTFVRLGWPSLLAKYYGAQARMLSKVVVIKEKIRLSSVDLKNLTFIKPVYLSKYGRYFAINSISTSGDEACSVELIMLPEGI